MAIIVQKYGGSSVGDLEKIKTVARRIAKVRERGDQVVVVVSAMGDSTDDLLKMAKSITDSPDRRELDMLLSCGERITMSLLSMAVKSLGHDAISFTGSQSGIITNDNHFNARIIEVRPFRVQDELERNRVVIVAGYQGTSYRREVTTLGRGGSDTTAVALAAALDAKYCEIYSDVDGVYSGDPNLIGQAEHIGELSYDEMEELARCGARVLNEQAVEFARNAGIAIYTRASGGGGGGRETVIRKVHRGGVSGVAGAGAAGGSAGVGAGGRALSGCHGLPPRVIGVAGRRGLTGLSVRGADHQWLCSILERSADSLPFMSMSSAFGGRAGGGGLMDELNGVDVDGRADAGLNEAGRVGGSPEAWCTILFDPAVSPLPCFEELLGGELQEEADWGSGSLVVRKGKVGGGCVRLLQPLCTVSAVGAMAGTSSNFVAQSRRALTDAGIEILGMSLSSPSITFILKDQDYTEGQRLLHGALIG